MAGVEAADARHDRAQAYFRAGNLDRCLELVEEELAENPRDSACLTLKGTVHLERDEPAAAVAALESATEIDPENHEAWSQLAAALLTEGRFDQAVEALRACQRIKPENVRTLTDLGNVLFMRGRKDEALESIEAARRLAPGELSILRNLAGMYVSAGRAEAALAVVREVLEFKPGDVAAQCDAAWLLLQLGRLEEAAEMFRAIGRSDPDREHELFAIHGLVMVAIRRQDWRQALMLAVDATRLDRYDFTTALLSYISSKVFDQETSVSEGELRERFEDEHRGIRSLHVGQSVI